MSAYEKIRAALELAASIHDDRMPYAEEMRRDELVESALTTLAELDRAASEPVAYQYAHPYFGGGKIWRQEQRWNGHTSDEARALYAAPPAPVAEIREPTPKECERICTEYERLLMREGTCGGRDAFDAVRAVMWPKSEVQS